MPNTPCLFLWCVRRVSTFNFPFSTFNFFLRFVYIFFNLIHHFIQCLQVFFFYIFQKSPIASLFILFLQISHQSQSLASCLSRNHLWQLLKLMHVSHLVCLFFFIPVIPSYACVYCCEWGVLVFDPEEDVCSFFEFPWPVHAHYFFL